jgi:hypothetical protein
MESGIELNDNGICVGGSEGSTYSHFSSKGVVGISFRLLKSPSIASKPDQSSDCENR